MDILIKVLDKYYFSKWNSFPSPTGTLADFENINWIGDAPDKSDFKKQYDAEEQAYKDTQYQRDRQYPAFGDQLDEIYHKGLNEWKKTIKAVKDKHPKP